MSFSFCFSQVNEFNDCDIKYHLINKNNFNINYLFVNKKKCRSTFEESYCSDGTINIKTEEGFLLNIKEEELENKLRITYINKNIEVEFSFNEKVIINFKGYSYLKKKVLIYFELKLKDCKYKLSLDFNDKKYVITEYDHFNTQ